MTKKFRIFWFLFTAATSVYSNGAWTEIYSQEESAFDPSGFEIIQAKYPLAFSHIEPSKIESAYMRITTFEYRGQHTCSNDDPKLRFEHIEHGTCERTFPGDGPACFTLSSLMPNDSDPCSTNNPIPLPF